MLFSQGTHSDMNNAKTAENIEKYFQPVMNGRKWCVNCCSAFDRAQILMALETLIDLMASNP